MANLDELYAAWQAMLPLKETDQARLDRKFMLDFNYNSNHIEGNTLTYGQTEVLLLLGEVVGTAKMKDLEEMKAHALCLKLMTAEAQRNHPLTESFVRALHQVMLREDYTVYRKLPGGETASYVVHAGRYKTRPNSVITRTGEKFEYASPEETAALMYDLISWYNEADAAGVLSPIELAALFHYRYIRIHPFEDGNGRIARLLVNFILLRHNYPMIVIRSRKKDAYLNALSAADKAIGPVPADGAHAAIEDIRPFVKYMKDVLITEISQNIAFVQTQKEQVWWYDGNLVTFRSANTPKILRFLSQNPRITIADLSKMLGINPSAVQKQLNTLTEKGYIIREGTPKEWHVIILSTT